MSAANTTPDFVIADEVHTVEDAAAHQAQKKAERLATIKALVADADSNYRRRLAAARAAGDPDYGDPVKISARGAARITSDTYCMVTARILDDSIVLAASGPAIDAAVAEFDSLDDDLAEEVHDWLHEALGTARPQLTAVEQLLAAAKEIAR